MNTSFKTLALLFSAALPTALAAESAGLPVPATLDATHLFGAFVLTFVALIAFTDYTRGARYLRVKAAAAQPARDRSHYPLAA